MRQYLAEQQVAFGRHIEHARLLEEKAFDELMSRDLKALKPYELIRLYDITSKIERDTWGLKSEIGNRISITCAHSRLSLYWKYSGLLEVFRRIRQELKGTGILSEEPVMASLQIVRVLERL
jgi:hypothetical protein